MAVSLPTQRTKPISDLTKQTILTYGNPRRASASPPAPRSTIPAPANRQRCRASWKMHRECLVDGHGWCHRTRNSLELHRKS